MIIEKITVQKVFPLGPYMNVKVGLEASVGEEEDIKVAITDAEELLNDWFSNAHPNISIPAGYVQEQQEDLFSGPIPPQKKVARNNKQSVLMKPDKEIRAKYAKAAVEQDHTTISQLESMYNFQIE